MQEDCQICLLKMIPFEISEAKIISELNEKHTS